MEQEWVKQIVGYTNEAKVLGVGILVMLEEKGIITRAESQQVWDDAMAFSAAAKQSGQAQPSGTNVVDFLSMRARLRPEPDNAPAP